MFERFTEPARQAIVLAQDEARTLAHNWIGTEHLLLALLRQQEGPAARVLEDLGVGLEPVRGDVVGMVGTGQGVASGQLPFTPRAKKALEGSLREALSLAHNHIGTEHILLGLVGDHGGVASRVLLELGADGQKVRSAVLQAMSAPEYEEHTAHHSAEASAVEHVVPMPRVEPPAPTPPSFAHALARALEKAAGAAGARSLDAGDLLVALLDQPDRLIASALAETDVDVGALRKAIEAARRREE